MPWETDSHVFSHIEGVRAQQVAIDDQAVEHTFEICIAFEAFLFTFASLRSPLGCLVSKR